MLTTPTNQIIKNINDLITSYLSYNYSIKSTKEFIEILKTHKPKNKKKKKKYYPLYTWEIYSQMFQFISKQSI